MKQSITRKYFLWLALVIFVIFILVVGILTFSGVMLDWAAILVFVGAVFGSLVTLLSFIQKQNLEETTLFKQLFTEFNNRYDEMNSDLNRIFIEDTSEELSLDDLNILYDYFNLCSEEFLFSKRGYIYPEVWKAWSKGIEFYLKNPRIRNLWEEEEKSDSYYGLTLEIILAGK